MNNRILAMLLAIIMIFSIVPVNAFAAENAGCTHTHNTACGYGEPCNCESNFAHSMNYMNGDCDANRFGSTGVCYYAQFNGACVDETGDSKCDACGKQQHTHVMQKVEAKPADCSNTGISMTYYKCTDKTCNKAYSDELGTKEIRESDYILNPEHTGLITYAAKSVTCTENGRTAYTWCSKCEKYFSDEAATVEITYGDTVVTAQGHDSVKKFSDEQHWQECEVCKDITSAKTFHGAFSYLKYDAEKHAVKCGGCDYVEYAAHVDEVGDDCICDWCGEALAHDYEYVYNKTTHHEVCNVCGDTTEAEAHDNICVPNNDGSHKSECSVCERSVGNDACVDADDNCYCDDCKVLMVHTQAEVEAGRVWVAPTCTAKGYKLHYVCATCTNVFEFEGDKAVLSSTAAVEVPPNGHTEAERHYADRHETYCTVCEAVISSEAHTFVYVSKGNELHGMSCTGCERNFSDEACVDVNSANCICDICKGNMNHVDAEMERVWSAQSCTKVGYKLHFKCKTCDKLFEYVGVVGTPLVETTLAKVTIPMDSHEEEWVFDRDNHKKVCTKCETVLVASTAHTYNYNDIGGGKHTAICSVCPFGETRDHVDEDKNCACDDCKVALDHKPVLDSGKEATCNDDGVKWHYECSVCGKMFWDQACKSEAAAKDIVIPKLGHEADPDDEPQCFLNGSYCGVHYDVCVRCRKILPVEHKDVNGDCVCDISGVLMHSHTIVPVAEKAATCYEEGLQAYYYYEGCEKMFADSAATIPLTAPYKISKVPHDDHGEWEACDDGVNHEKVCGNENCNVVLDTKPHDFSGDAPYCVDCGAAEGLVHKEEVPATCAATGLKEHWVSSITNRSYWDAKGTRYISDVNRLIIPKLSHETEIEAVDGRVHAEVCVNDCGYTRNLECESADDDCICDECDEILKGHEPETIAYIAATCDEDGQKAAVYCPGCDEYKDAEGNVLDTIVIPALGHDWDEQHTADGEHYRECKRTDCDAKETAPCESEDKDCFCDECGYSLPGHTFVEYKYIAPTCTKPGQMAAVYCETCKQYYETEEYEIVKSIVLNALGHDYSGEWYNDTREIAHSKDCQRSGCNVKLTAAHELTCESVNKGNMHEFSCSVCNYKKSGIHADNDGDTICDECAYESNKVVSGSSLNNPRDVVTIKGDKDASTQEKKNTWWKDFVGKLNPSYVGESQSDSAPSASVDSPATNGSGSTSSGTVNSGNDSPSTGSSAVDIVIDFLMNLLNTLLGI